MGAYTWTYIRIDKLNYTQTKRCIEQAIESSRNTTFGHYSKLTEEEYIPKWIKMHKDEYDYFVNNCGVPPEQITDEYLTKQIKSYMKQWRYTQRCYQKVLNGEMRFDEMCRKTHQLTGRTMISDLMIIKHKGYYYVHIDYEIFRNYEYCEENFDTVDSLIKHLENPNCKSICDFTDINEDNVQYEYGPLSDKLREKIINYYSQIGDGNFVVHFG